MNNPQYTDSYVALLDILGFKEYTNKNGFSYVLNMLRDITKFAQMVLKSSNDIISEHMLNTVTLNIISDSIFISVPKSTERSLEILLLVVDHVVSLLTYKYEVLIRGGISEGDYYADSTLAFGPALVKAYTLESSLAVYPRIILTRETLETYTKNLTIDIIEWLYELITLDADEQIFFADYIGFAFIKISDEVQKNRITIMDAENFFKKIKLFIEDELATRTEKQVREKYLYFRNYYNYTINYLTSKFGYSFPVELIFNEKSNNYEFIDGEIIV